ncbi:hypothetical protein NDU88_000122 [Pleurodeles waltl]|uniref:Uncharacterized protein n=2 Tax=Pleurodeles waltl TaxID=8319 RepID=A0AAV7KM98_PLEWA|nr:hypothetical protein NDU88_000122 [Pleurodeles waltl]
MEQGQQQEWEKMKNTAQKEQGPIKLEPSKLGSQKKELVKADPLKTGLSRVQPPQAEFLKVEPPKIEPPEEKILNNEKVKTEAMSTKTPKVEVPTSDPPKMKVLKPKDSKADSLNAKLSKDIPVAKRQKADTSKPESPQAVLSKKNNVKEGPLVKSPLPSAPPVHQHTFYRPSRPSFSVPHRPPAALKQLPVHSVTPLMQGHYVKNKESKTTKGNNKFESLSKEGDNRKEHSQLREQGGLKYMTKQEEGLNKKEPSKLGSSKKEPIKAESAKVGLSRIHPPKAEFLKERPPKTELLKAKNLQNEKVKTETMRTKNPKAELSKAEPPKEKVLKAKTSETERAKLKKGPTKAGLSKAGPQRAEHLTAEFSKGIPIAKLQKARTPIPEFPQTEFPNDNMREGLLVKSQLPSVPLVHQQAFFQPCRPPQTSSVPHRPPAPPQQYPMYSVPPLMSPDPSVCQPRFPVVSYAPSMPSQVPQQLPLMPQSTVPPPFLSVPQLRPSGPPSHLPGLPLCPPFLHIPMMENNESPPRQPGYFMLTSMPTQDFPGPPAHLQRFSLQVPVPPVSPLVIHGPPSHPHALPEPPVYPQESLMSYEVPSKPQVPQQEGIVRPPPPVVMVHAPFNLTDAFPFNGPSGSVSGPYSYEGTTVMVPIPNQGTTSPAQMVFSMPHAVPFQDAWYACAPLSATPGTSYTSQKDSNSAHFTFTDQDVLGTTPSNVENLDVQKPTHNVANVQESSSQPCHGDEDIDSFMEKIKTEMQALWPDADNSLKSRSRSRSSSLSSPQRKHSRLTPSKHSSYLPRSRNLSPWSRGRSWHSRSRSRHSRSRSRGSRNRSWRSRSRSRRSRSLSRRSRSLSRRSRSLSRRSRSLSRRSRSLSRRSRSLSRRSRSLSRRSRSLSRRSRSLSRRSRSLSRRSRSRSRPLRRRSLRSRRRSLRSRHRSLSSRRRPLRSRSRSLRLRRQSLRSRNRSPR